ncbi:MAG: cellobiose phosphorylase [Lentisphaerota bacterium]
MQKTSTSWWHFSDSAGCFPATGQFVASGAEQIDRLYYPLFNESGILSWTSPRLQGGPVSNHNESFGFPLTAEDLPHCLAHRGFWMTGIGREPFSLSFSPDDLKNSAAGKSSASTAVEAAPGWFRLIRQDPARRFSVSATLWCPVDRAEKMEIMQVKVTNTSQRTIAFVPYAAIPVYARSVDNIRDHRHVTALLTRVKMQPNGLIVCPTMTFDERGHKLNKIRYVVTALGAGKNKPEGIWPTQDSFLGEGGTFAAPKAVWQQEQAPKLAGHQVQGREVTAAFRFKKTTLKPGASATFTLMCEIADSDAAYARSLKWTSSGDNLARSLKETSQYWRQRVQRIALGSPDATLNNWLSWVNFQPILRRFYGNSFLPQFDYGRGGKGWRDLWQDCLALLLSDPASVRHLLLQNFGGVRIDGSNATIIGKGGTFIADRNNIPRTWMDHGIWPAYTTLLYVDQTGDVDFLLEKREYFRDPQLFRCRRKDTAWTPGYGFNLRTHQHKVYQGTVFEHMLAQNLAAFFNVGEHNLCRLEGADWNDGLDMADERGESVAFSAFYAWNLNRLADTALMLARHGQKVLELPEEMGELLDRLPGSKPVNYAAPSSKIKRLEQYLDRVAGDISGRKLAVKPADLAKDLRAKSEDISRRIRSQEWIKAKPGLSMFNGYYDNHGRRVEGRTAKGVRMTLTGQVFPIMAGIATEDQIASAIKSCRKLLSDPLTGGIRLNTDFGEIQPALGRAFSFAYGEKENGAVFSHMAVMYAYALYLRRKPEEGRAVWHKLFEMAVNSPVAKIFPCVPEYFNAEGRGLYTYLTGSASWLIYLLLTRVYGLRGKTGDLIVDPQLTPDDFDGKTTTRISFPFAGRTLDVTFENPQHLAPAQYEVIAILIDGRSVGFERDPEGGVRIAIKQLKVFSTKKPLKVVVQLARA